MFRVVARDEVGGSCGFKSCQAFPAESERSPVPFYLMRCVTLVRNNTVVSHFGHGK